MLAIMVHSQHTRGMLLLLFCCCNSILLLPCTSISEEGKILLRVKEVDWVNNHSLNDWNASQQNPCGWNGVQCNSFDSVTALNLTAALISGRLTSALCDLPNLTTLVLQNNSFSGPFPDGLLKCKLLEKLDLSYNQFTGNLPNLINELSELKVLDLSHNAFSSDVPAAFGLLPKVEALFFHANSLSGTVPAFMGKLTTLTNFTIGDNPLHPGAIPKEFANLKRLQQLWLYNCNLTGEIPNSFGNLTQLELLDLSQNHLSGDIPNSLMALLKMRSLLLYQNNLSGQIPSNIGEMRSLVWLDLDLNQLWGEIPESISNLTELHTLNLADNKLTGEVPAGIGNLRHLTELKLFGNNLTGWLPQSLGTFSSIVLLDVTGCGLEGPLPKNLCRARTLYSLAVSSNSFNGSLPTSLEDCESLHYAQLQNNLLSGEIPAGLWGAPNLVQLFLHDNNFEGQISDAIGRAKNQVELDISNNRFGGSIPAQVGQLKSLGSFIASHNCFSGPIPEELAGLSSITTLHLDHNSLSGKISKGVTSLKKVTDLNLADNRLTGEIPASLGAMSVLTFLDLSNNLLSGEIPSQLGSLRLNVLNVSGNQLSGPVPAALDIPAYSFLNNPGLCGDRKLGIPSCSSSTKLLSKRLASILVPSLMVAAVALLFISLCCFRIFSSKTPIGNFLWKLIPFQSSFHIDEVYILRNLTENNLIGSGGAGKVYKVTLHNQEAVAVKKIQIRSARSKSKAQQEKNELEVEVNTLGLIRHLNILKLLCCISSEEADYKLLVYEYMPNGSLFDRLHRPETALEWPIRYNIAVGAARGLKYMHHDCTPPIMHRDVKSSNILLDADFQAKIADFGLSRLLENLGHEYCVSGYVGSHGYIAPEYAGRSKVNEKIDVYSFGVVLLELVSGKKATEEVDYGVGVDIVAWIRNTIWMERNEQGVLDRRIVDVKYKEQMVRVLRVGLLCTHRSPKQRPSMRDVVDMLFTCNVDEQRRDKITLQHSRRPSESGSVACTMPHYQSENEEAVFSS